jgi:hypothetical protein
MCSGSRETTVCWRRQSYIIKDTSDGMAWHGWSSDQGPRESIVLGK